MISLNRLMAAIAATATLQLGLMRVVSAQNNTTQNDSSWCFDSRFDNLNATASYSVPGFKAPGDNSESTWTFSTGVVTYGGNTTRRFWVNTSPAIEVDSDSLPYQGCTIELLDLVAKPGKENDGDCTSSLGKECVAALLKQTNAKTKIFTTLADQLSPSNKTLGGSNLAPSFAQCAGLVTVLPTECGRTDRVNTYTVADIGRHPSHWANDTLAREHGFEVAGRCPDRGTNGTAATSPLYELNTTSAYEDPLDIIAKYRTYDQWRDQVLPVLIPVWSKSGSGSDAWSDSRLICMRPEEVQPGQALPAARKAGKAAGGSSSSAGVRIGGYSQWIVVVMIGLISVGGALCLF